MKFTMTEPCSDCPFRRVGGIRLTPDRVEEIAGMMLDGQGGTFPCHKTVDYGREDREADEDGDGIGFGNKNGRRAIGAKEVHCAGALIFAEKNGNATQMMRIAERLRLYDARKLMGSPVVAEVFDSIDEMMETAWR
jgi:hypothetical protein